MAEDLYSQMAQTVIDGELELAEELARKGLAAGLSPGDIPASTWPMTSGSQSPGSGSRPRLQMASFQLPAFVVVLWLGVYT